jgi:hypothetical protein
MNPHVIRLRGPWELQIGTGAVRESFPCPWKNLTSAFSSEKALLRRRFQSPTNLAAGDQVRIVFAHLTGEVEVRLNQKVLGVLDSPGSFDVTSKLLVSNILELTIITAGEPEATAMDVQLEILTTN